MLCSVVKFVKCFAHSKPSSHGREVDDNDDDFTRKVPAILHSPLCSMTLDRLVFSSGSPDEAGLLKGPLSA